MVICLVSHGNFLFPFSGKCFSVTVLTPRGAVQHLICASSLQSGQQVNDLLRYRTSSLIRIVNTVDTAAAPMNVSGVQSWKVFSMSSPSD